MVGELWMPHGTTGKIRISLREFRSPLKTASPPAANTLESFKRETFRRLEGRRCVISHPNGAGRGSPLFLRRKGFRK
ncbi:hypothetical protein NPIL_663761 [Nephila pilipes]|uniref:Uncharacterized protein n=1 Tax=Nephila pilipes TaxID=299642 RepID=A0A8X6QUN8_NEPPI|nr:hypothetical protein NPIL_663761 [Nephila pilipes]